MKSLLVTIVAASLLAPGGKTLRYQYKPGKTFRFELKQRAAGSTKSGSLDSPTGTQETKTQVELKCISSSAGKSVVEEFVKPGTTITAGTSGLGSEAASPASKHRITYGSRGEVLKWEGLPVAGITPQPTFLEGLSIPLPEQTVSVGDLWAGYTSARGFDGKPFKIKYNSRYSANAQAMGHPCVVIETILISSFTATQPQTNAKMSGTLSGKMTSYFATDLGQDVKGEAELNVELKQSADTIHKLKTYASQTLIK
jgi:hypothetical protein